MAGQRGHVHPERPGNRRCARWGNSVGSNLSLVSGERRASTCAWKTCWEEPGEGEGENKAGSWARSEGKEVM